MKNLTRKAFGGYFELELSRQSEFFHSNALRFQSARAAFYAILNVRRPARVFVPKYLCDSMISSPQRLGIEIVFYDLDPTLNILGAIDLNENDVLLYVNYFGVCSENVAQLVRTIDPMMLIVDNSQAFFEKPVNCLATIYSPRKFFGVPDGGLLHTVLPFEMPIQKDVDSIEKFTHLLKRLDSTAESGYKDFLKAELLFDDVTPKLMSTISESLLLSINYDSVRESRNKNFNFLNDHLGSFNNCEFKLENVNAPLCYPLLTGDTGLRRRLLDNRVFTATYWPDVKNRVEPNSIESLMVDQCVPIPCDQRYTEMDMSVIVDIIANS